LSRHKHDQRAGGVTIARASNTPEERTMSYIDTRMHGAGALAVEPGGYVRTAPGVVEHWPTFARIWNSVLRYLVPPCAPVPEVPYVPELPTTGARLPHRWHRERVQHGQHSGDVILCRADDSRVLAARRVAAWGDVLAVYSGDGQHLDVLVYDDAAADPDVLASRWPFGPVRVLQ
jgi:hypothetical protein